MVDHDRQPPSTEHSPLDTLFLESIEHLFGRAEELGKHQDREKLTAQIVLIETLRRSAPNVTRNEYSRLPEDLFHYLADQDRTGLLVSLNRLEFSGPLHNLGIQLDGRDADSYISPHFQLALLRDWSALVAESKGWYGEVKQMIDEKYSLESDAVRRVIADLSAFCASELDKALLQGPPELWPATGLAYINIQRWLPEMLEEADQTP